MTAMIYTRISRDDAGDGLGVRRQAEDCLALAARRGVRVSQTLTDNDVSAYSGRTRPAYQTLLGAIAANQVRTVFAWAPERLHRSPRELEDFLELIERHGVNVETVKAGAWDVSTSHGRLVARMLGAVSRAESERTGERVSRAHQQAKASGRWRGPIPYGLRAGNYPGLPEIDPEQAPIVRDVCQRILRGDALTRIATDLNHAGIRPRRGVAWTHTGVLRLIQSPAIGGLVAVDNELRPAAFEGVVDAMTWRSANASIRSRPRGEKRRPRETLTLLGNIMVCAEHDHPCVGGSATHGAVYSASGPGMCYVMIKREPADQLVTATVLARLRRPDARQLFQPVVDPNLETEGLALRQRRDDIAVLLSEGLLGATAARAELEKLAERLDRIEEANTRPLIDLDLFDAPGRAWSALTQPQRREVVRILFERIALHHVGSTNGPRANPGRIILDWRQGSRGQGHQRLRR